MTGHFTMGHVLYVIAAVDAAIALVMALRLRDAPDPVTDEERTRRRSRGFVVLNLLVTAIALCLVGHFLPAVQQPIF